MTKNQKINPVGAALWAAVLAAIPGSHLRVQTGGFADAGLRRTITRMLTEAGIPAKRLILAADPPDYPAYLAAFTEIDFLLDTTPYNGVTTTCEALWQGVPVIALAGDRQAARAAASILTAAGLGDLVAPDAADYVALARDLAGNASRLGALREGLRARLANSALCDASAFARGIEAAYRTMWRRFCTGEPARDLVVPGGGPW